MNDLPMSGRGLIAALERMYEAAPPNRDYTLYAGAEFRRAVEQWVQEFYDEQIQLHNNSTDIFGKSDHVKTKPGLSGQVCLFDEQDM